MSNGGDMNEYYLWGGWSYANPDTPETFDTIEDAAAAYADRYLSNGIRTIDGIYYPTWGECMGTDYVITTEDGEAWTRDEVFGLAGVEA